MKGKTYEKAECWECGRELDKRFMYSIELTDRPFDKDSHIEHFCKTAPKDISKRMYNESCLDLLGDNSWADFRYFMCDGCYRMVCEQNPSNGWHSQVRYLDDGCTQYCLRCYEEHILENGVDIEEFEAGHLPGMFFSSDNNEPLGAGYSIDGRVNNYKVGNPEPVLDIAIAHINEGHKILIGYERMAIGGLEGYVTLFYK